jgi:membrane fusion protein (multidrug efflux system)
VPQQAVTRDNRGDAIALVVGPDGKVESRKLVIARAIGNEWLVDAGLNAGDRVIVEGSQRARPGSVVQAVERRIGAPAADPAPPQAGGDEKPAPATKAGDAARS